MRGKWDIIEECKVQHGVDFERYIWLAILELICDLRTELWNVRKAIEGSKK